MGFSGVFIFYSSLWKITAKVKLQGPGHSILISLSLDAVVECRTDISAASVPNDSGGGGKDERGTLGNVGRLEKNGGILDKVIAFFDLCFWLQICEFSFLVTFLKWLSENILFCFLI